MTPLIRDAPDSLRCEADLHSVRIRMRPSVRLLGLVVGVFIIACNLSLGVAIASLDVAAVAGLGAVLLPLDLAWVWSIRGQRALNITVDVHILEVHQSWFGAHYRIPLVDITAARLTPDRQLRIELADDIIHIGKGFDRTELAWLAKVVRDAAKAARERPEHRQGTPDEVPRKLAALTADR